jgi:Ni/Co efflux regulator RcnB
MRLSVVALSLATLLLVPAPPARTWMELGPRSSGRVSAIAVTDWEHLWAASPGGGVWKTADGGAHWIWAGNYGLGDFTALDLEFDRNAPNRLYLRTWNGFLVSTDGAAHWKQTLYGQGQGGDTSYYQPSFACGVFPACPPYASVTDFEPRPFTQMVLSPHQSILLTSLPCGGLQYSTDSGNTFKQLWPFPAAHPETNADNCIISIAADEATGKVYFASMGSGDSVHIFRSSAAWTATGPPAALRWELVNQGFNAHEPAASLAWGGSANRLMAVVTDWSVQPSHATAYLFDGARWTPKPFNNARCIMSDARALVWAGGNDFFVGGVTFGYTANAGNSWVCPDLNQQYVDIRSIHADRKLKQVWIGGDQSALESHFVISRYPWTPGASIAPASGSDGLGISSWQAYTVAAPPSGEHRDRIIVGAQDVTAACTDDDGAHWRLLPTDESQSIVWRKNGSGDVVYSYSTLGTLQRSTNAGSAPMCANITFTSASPPDSLRESKAFVGPHTMAVHPMDANRVYLASARSIIYSTNGGAHWAKAPFSVPGRSKTPAPTSIFVDESGALYAGTLDGGAFVCNDAVHLCDGSAGAGKWEPWGLNSASPRMITAIVESNAPPAPRTFWMATSQGLYRKLPGAAAWTLASTTPGYVSSDVAVDPTCHSRIYAALGYLEPISRSRGGIDFSSNNGASWTSLTSGAPLHNVPVTQVILAPENPGRVLASTYGRGSWEYDWGQLPPCGN